MKLFKRTSAVLLAFVLIAVAVCGLPMTASAYSAPENASLTVRAESEFFGSAEAFYSDLSQYEDESGNVFVTVEFKMRASGKYLVNFDMGELTWDPDVLEWKEEYNKIKKGRITLFDLFPVIAENGFGTGTYNSFGDSNGGRVVGNHTGIAPAAKAYSANNGEVTFVKAVFKVLDRTAGVTTVRCHMEEVSLCDDTIAQPYAQYKPVTREVINSEVADALTERSVKITPETQVAVKGDTDGDGTMTINDVTNLQQMLCEFTDAEGHPLFDETDATLFYTADINGDGKFNVHDITAAQRILAEFGE